MLEDALKALGPKLGGPVTGLRRLSGGASQETWAFKAGDRDLILRRKPDGAMDRDHAVDLYTEAALIQTVAKRGAPAPEVIHVCGPEDGIGIAFIMASVEGETLGRRIVRDEAFAGIRPGLARRCGEVLAQIHSTPTEGLPPLRTADAADEIARFEEVYHMAGAKRPILEAAFRWLKNRAGAMKIERPVLVHGDFRNGNLMIHPQRGLAAVLDWELAHLGDPADDMGWLCTASWRFGGNKPVGGFGDYEDLLAGYEAAGGKPIPLERVLFWQTFGSLKWGVMCMMMYTSFATRADPSVERAMIGRRTSETEIDLIALLERAA